MSPARAALSACSALAGLDFARSNPGFRPLCGLHPGLCCPALSALCYCLLSLTRMPLRALLFANSYQGFAPLTPGYDYCVPPGLKSVEIQYLFCQ